MNALLISLIVLFIHSCTWDGMIFARIKDYIKPKGMLYKPIYGCPICMTPYYGTLIYLLFINVSFADYIMTIGGASGFSVLWICVLAIRNYLNGE